MWSVGKVEKLGAENDSIALTYHRDCFLKIHVEIVVSGSTQDVASAVSEGPKCILLKCRDVEILLDELVSRAIRIQKRRNAWDEICKVEAVAGQGIVHTGIHTERLTHLPLPDGANLPTGENILEHEAMLLERR